MSQFLLKPFWTFSNRSSKKTKLVDLLQQWIMRTISWNFAKNGLKFDLWCFFRSLLKNPNQMQRTFLDLDFKFTYSHSHKSKDNSIIYQNLQVEIRMMLFIFWKTWSDRMSLFIGFHVLFLLLALPALPSHSVKCQAKWKTLEIREASLTITEDEDNNLLFSLDNDFTTGLVW